MYSLRPATLDDIAAVVDLVNRERVAQTGETATTEQNLKRRWTHPGVDLARDTCLVIGPDGLLAANITFDNTREPLSRPYANISIAPGAEPVEAGRLVVEWLVERAAKEIPRVEADVRVTVLAWAIEENRAVLDALAAAGFEETRQFYTMRIEFDAPAQGDGATDGAQASSRSAGIPDGYEIRPLRVEEERAAFRAMDLAFADHYGHGEPDDSEESFQRWRYSLIEPEDALPELQLAAVDTSGTIAGMSFCRPERPQDKDLAWVNVLGVHPDHRRKGLGEALLLESFAAFARIGKKRAGLGVDASSLTNATRLYEKCGMHVHQKTIQMGKVIREGREVANLG